MRAVDGSTHMAIRLVMRGCVNRPFYHVVVQGNRQPALRKVKDQIGTYDPMVNVHGEKIVALDFNKLRYWLFERKAQPTVPVLRLLGYSGFYPIHPTTRLQSYRLTKKAEAAALEEQQAVEQAQNEEEIAH